MSSLNRASPACRPAAARNCREQDATSVVPVDPPPSMNGVGEGQPHEVAATLGKATRVPQRRESLIPCHKVEPLAEEAGRCRHQRGEQTGELGGGTFGHLVGLGSGKTGEVAKMAVVLLVEAEPTG